MSESSFTSIRNATIASVIAGIVMLAIPDARAYLVKFLSWVWSGLTWCWTSLMTSYALPGWTWIILFVFALIGAASVFFRLKGETAKPEHHSYIEDNMYGAKWRWQWVSNRVFNAWCYCPRCEATLVYDDSSCHRFSYEEKKTNFICENCGHSVVASIPGGNKAYALGAVEREIDRRIRTGEYKRH
ncbi:hypothetical protein [uncultured Pseudomonas sp.]|uniref:hypothetical protein n=1 Tax=uncultured Pseudomonas sp. TaxID=114707 RepID=UPI0026270458|nr:hypothetical protein [uncultured Pseudomonas sp.]